jgi:hypothetical protein
MPLAPSGLDEVRGSIHGRDDDTIAHHVNDANAIADVQRRSITDHLNNFISELHFARGAQGRRGNAVLSKQVFVIC